MVNKLDSIDNEFRVFKMEILAGDEDLVAQAVGLQKLELMTLHEVFMLSKHSDHHSLTRLLCPPPYRKKPTVPLPLTSPKSTGIPVFLTNTNVSFKITSNQGKS